MKILTSFFITILVSSILYANGLKPKEQLGKNIFFDKISSPDWMSCATCHAPEVGFTGPIPGINAHGSVYRGATPQRFGNRRPPSAAYAAHSPVFHYDETEKLFIGGNFWDGRATGEKLGNPAAEQAQGPFLNPVEHNNPNMESILKQIAESKYASLWEEVWGEPISHETEEEISKNYDRVGLSIAAYEKSSEVSPFNSKYDKSLAGEVELTDEESWGLELFEGKGKCSSCHPSSVDINVKEVDKEIPPLFTDFTFDNLGTPKNPENPFYDMDRVYLDDGTPINPEGSDWIDKGLGGFLETLENTEWAEWADLAGENMGKHKVPTLRNVAKKPGKGYPKSYMHNGVFKSLKEVVHFYNTRDREDLESWPPPEVDKNINRDELGDLELTDEEEDALVAFMQTLSDGYDPEKDKVKNKNKIVKMENKINIVKKSSLKITGPNPFNPQTQFSYVLGNDGDISINIYNVMGQKLFTIVQEHKMAGEYTYAWNASLMPSGTYFLVMQTDNKMFTQKLLLIK